MNVVLRCLIYAAASCYGVLFLLVDLFGLATRAEESRLLLIILKIEHAIEEKRKIKGTKGTFVEPP